MLHKIKKPGALVKAIEIYIAEDYYLNGETEVQDIMGELWIHIEEIEKIMDRENLFISIDDEQNLAQQILEQKLDYEFVVKSLLADRKDFISEINSLKEEFNELVEEHKELEHEIGFRSDEDRWIKK